MSENEEFVEWCKGLPAMENRYDWKQEESWRRFVDDWKSKRQTRKV